MKSRLSDFNLPVLSAQTRFGITLLLALLGMAALAGLDGKAPHSPTQTTHALQVTHHHP